MPFNFDRMVDEIADLIAGRALEKINERLVVLAVGALQQYRARIGRDHGSVGRDLVAITACDEHDHARKKARRRVCNIIARDYADPADGSLFGAAASGCRQHPLHRCARHRPTRAPASTTPPASQSVAAA